MSQQSHLRKLRRSVLKKRSSEAYALLRRLEDAEPDLHPNLQLVGVLLLLWQGRFSVARERLRLLSESVGRDPKALLLGAYIDLLDERERDAVIKYSQLLGQPTHAKKAEWVLNQIKDGDYREVLSRHALEDFLFPIEDLFDRGASHRFLLKWTAILFLVFLFVGLAWVFWEAFRGRLGALTDDLRLRWFATTEHSEQVAGELFYLNVFTSRERKRLLRVVPEVMSPQTEGSEGASAAPKSSWDYSSDELERYLSAMRFFIHARRINSAIVVYNRMVRSSIPLRYEERFRILRSSVPEPNFKTFENSLKIRALLTNPYTTETYVKWKGFFSRRAKEWFFSVEEEGGLTYTAKVFFPVLPVGLKEREEVVLLAQSKGLLGKQLLVEALVVQPVLGR